MRIKLLILLPLLVCFAGPVQAQLVTHRNVEHHKNVVPFTYAYSDEQNGATILIKAKVNGHPVVLVFDTGASAMLVTADHLEGAKPIGEQPVLGATGSVPSKVYLTEIEIGSDTFGDQVVYTQSAWGLSIVLSTHVDGLLGTTILDHYQRITIDRKTKTITLEK